MVSLRKREQTRRGGARKARNARGFTLVEVLVVLAIAAIVAAVSIPSLVNWYNSYKATERQDNAELIYTTAQNNVQQLKADGRLSDVAGGTTALTGARVTLASALSQATAGSTKASASALQADAGMVELNSDSADGSHSAALDVVVPNIADSLSRVGYSSVSYATGAHYRIELNPQTGYVYRTFFSEDAISDDAYASAAQAVSVLQSSTDAAARENAQKALNDLHISYYGGTVPKTFAPEEGQPVRWAGYFEFAQADGQTKATGGYFYQINSDGSTADTATDKLHNANQITEGAVDSTDGTAYGILVAKSMVDGGSFTPPTDVGATRYDVTLADDFGVDGVEADCYFYKLSTPGASQNANYTVQYQYWQYDWQGNPVYYNNSASVLHTGAVGSTVQVTNGDLQADNDYVRQILQNGTYRIDYDRSTLTGTVKQDGSLVLTVALLQNRTGETGPTTVPDFPTSKTSLVNGVGVWYPWSTSGVDALSDKAFYVDENFAGAINPGTASTANDTYQVRTDDQLQHIGSPYGSTDNAPLTAYLSGTFYQTHDIAIDQLWYPIGQNAANNAQDPQFSGAFYGSYAGSAQDALAEGDVLDLQAPADGDQAFAITFAKRTDANSDAEASAPFSVDPAYQTPDTFRSYGVFGYVTGSIDYAHVAVGEQLAQTFYVPHYGTLAGDLRDGSISRSVVTVPQGSALAITQSSADSSRQTDVSAIAGLCGVMSGNARISASSFVLAQDASQSTRLSFASEAGPNAKSSLNTAGFVGTVACGSAVPLENCTLDLHGNVRIAGDGASSGQTCTGGFVGSFAGGGAINGCSMNVDGAIVVGSPDNSSSWNPVVSTGGFVGKLGDAASAGAQEDASSITGSTLAITANGSLSVSTRYVGGTLGTGGFAGDLYGAASLSNDTIADDGALNVEGAASGYGSSVGMGGFIGQVAARSSASTAPTAQGCTITGTGNVNVDVGLSGVGVRAGGFIGNVPANVAVQGSSVSVDGNINVVSENSAQAEGFVGGFAGTVQDGGSVDGATVASHKGAVTVRAVSSNTRYAGGVAGRVSNGSKLTGSSLSAATGAHVSAEGADNGYGASYSGGIVGDADNGTVDNASATVTGGSDIRGVSSASAYAGGLAGYAQSSSVGSPNLSFGDLTVAANGDGYNTGRAAGLIGSVNGASAQAASQISSAKLQVSGTLSATTQTGANGTTSYVGGMFGNAEGYARIDGAQLTARYVNLAGESNTAAYAGGLIGHLEGDAVLTAPTVAIGSASARGSISVASTGRDDASAYAGGLVGRAESSADTGSGSGAVAVSGGNITVEGDASFTASSADGTYAGGIAGRVNAPDVSKTSATFNGALTATATCTNDNKGEAHAGGLIGEAATDNGTLGLTDLHLSLAQGANIAAQGSHEMYAGGLVGRAKSVAASYLSLEESTSTGSADGRSIAVSTTARNGATPSNYVGGAIGRALDSDAQNSYVAARNAVLELNSATGGNAGGFAGYLSKDANDRSEKGASFCYVSADIRSARNDGISGFADRTDHALVRSCFVMGTLAADNGSAFDSDKASALVRVPTFDNSVRERPAGDYTVVTDAQGNTPYNFLGTKPEDANIATPACCVYKAGQIDPKADRDHGAHAVSLDWLAGTQAYDEGYAHRTYNPEDDPYYYENFVSFVQSKNSYETRYPFVMGGDSRVKARDDGSLYGLSGTNPFPTATRDANGDYVNAGKWLAPQGN